MGKEPESREESKETKGTKEREREREREESAESRRNEPVKDDGMTLARWNRPPAQNSGPRIEAGPSRPAGAVDLTWTRCHHRVRSGQISVSEVFGWALRALAIAGVSVPEHREGLRILWTASTLYIHHGEQEEDVPFMVVDLAE